jgi:hemerythrin-like domain-containing protein
MPDTLALWHADHVNFSKLLDLLDGQLKLFHEGGSPEYELMLDIMYYMTHYSDVLHHPKEDLVFAKVKEREKSAGPTIDDLTKQHLRLKEAGDELVHAIDGVVNGSISSREQVEACARSYVTNLRSHMRTEETEILPLAARLLQAKDWAAIDAAIGHVEDPLFGSGAEARYAALRQQIVRQARQKE